MSVRTGKGSLRKTLTPAKRRAAGRRGNSTQISNSRSAPVYGDGIPF